MNNSKVLSFLIFFLILGFFIVLPPKTFSSTNLTINEFLAHPSSGNKEWVEFYNPDHIDLSEYFVDDDNSFDEKPEYGSSKKKLSSVSIDISNSDFPFITLSSSMFNNTCDSTCDYITLFSPDGSLIDQFQYTNEQIQEKGSSIGRYPDGSNNWIVFANLTKGLTNNSSSPIPSDTPVPTKTPTPIKTPTKAPTAKSTKASPTSFTKSASSPATSQVQKTVSNSSKSVLGDKNQPTINLIDEKYTSTPTPTLKSSEKTRDVKTLGASQNNLPKILIGAGVIFVILCGILFGRSFRKRISVEKNE